MPSLVPPQTQAGELRFSANWLNAAPANEFSFVALLSTMSESLPKYLAYAENEHTGLLSVVNER